MCSGKSHPYVKFGALRESFYNKLIGLLNFKDTRGRKNAFRELYRCEERGYMWVPIRRRHGIDLELTKRPDLTKN
jgi:hypothetical protein